MQVNDEGKRQNKGVKEKGPGTDSKAVHTGCSSGTLVMIAQEKTTALACIGSFN